MIDVESLVQTFLTGFLPEGRICTETPDKMERVVPVVQVTRITGGGRRNLDMAVIDIDVFHIDRDDARKFAERVRDAMLYSLPGKSVGPGFVTGCDNPIGPVFRNWENQNMRRFGATYEVWVKPTYR